MRMVNIVITLLISLYVVRLLNLQLYPFHHLCLIIDGKLHHLGLLGRCNKSRKLYEKWS